MRAQLFSLKEDEKAERQQLKRIEMSLQESVRMEADAQRKAVKQRALLVEKKSKASLIDLKINTLKEELRMREIQDNRENVQHYRRMSDHRRASVEAVQLGQAGTTRAVSTPDLFNERPASANRYGTGIVYAEPGNGMEWAKPPSSAPHSAALAPKPRQPRVHSGGSRRTAQRGSAMEMDLAAPWSSGDLMPAAPDAEVSMGSSSRSAPDLLGSVASSVSQPMRLGDGAAETARERIRAALASVPIGRTCTKSAGKFGEDPSAPCGPYVAFHMIDCSGSGRVTYGEFESAISRFGIRWQELTGIKRVNDLFRLFDHDNAGYLDKAKLFPSILVDPDRTNLSTPDFWKKYCRRTRDVDPVEKRSAVWAPTGLEADLHKAQMLSNNLTEIDRKRRAMKATFWRLKARGKSDARCREVVALHLPKGTGPLVSDSVPMFCKKDVSACHRRYTEAINNDVKKITKNVADIRDSRAALTTCKRTMLSIDSLRKYEEERRNAAQKDHLASFGFTGFGAAKNAAGSGGMAGQDDLPQASDSD